MKIKMGLVNKILIFTIFIVLIFISIFLYKNYSLEKKYQEKYSTRNSKFLLSPTPTIYLCPTINQKTQEDIEQENAENNLSSYIIKENVENPYPDKNTTEQIDKISILEKKLIPCQPIDEKYCLISNNSSWNIKYPKTWKLYRVKRNVSETVFGKTYTNDFYDLKFEYKDSYFYLKESITLGGNPIILSDVQWSHLSKFCPDKFYTTDKTNNYICPGNIIGCAGNMEGDKRIIYSINNFYKSFISTNSTVQKKETLIYNWYIPSLDFERQKLFGASRIYTFSNNFYSNDKEFIDEIKRIYIDLVKKF